MTIVVMVMLEMAVYAVSQYSKHSKDADPSRWSYFNNSRAARVLCTQLQGLVKEESAIDELSQRFTYNATHEYPPRIPLPEEQKMQRAQKKVYTRRTSCWMRTQETDKRV